MVVNKRNSDGNGGGAGDRTRVLEFLRRDVYMRSLFTEISL